MNSPAVHAAGVTPNAPDMRRVSLRVNGKPYSAEVESRTTLVDFLRHSLLLTGTHVGCEHGVCGACTILIDGRSARSCLTLAVQAEGSKIQTVEGLAAADGKLSLLQQAFQRNFALQCGYCTPGILMSLAHYLETNPSPSEQQLREVIGGHLCRCTGYTHIMAAAVEAAAAMRQAG